MRAFLPARAVRGVELQWLVRRAFCQGTRRARSIDGLHEPRALAFERNGKALLAPLEGDVMRWADGHVTQRGRAAPSRIGARVKLAGTPRDGRYPGPT